MLSLIFISHYRLFHLKHSSLALNNILFFKYLFNSQIKENNFYVWLNMYSKIFKLPYLLQ